MMRIRLSVVLLCTAGILAPTLSWGQVQSCYDAYVTAQYDGSVMQLQLSIGQRLFGGPFVCRGNAVGFDVFRKTLGHECGPEIRVTDQPIAWPVVEPYEVFEVGLTDPGVTVDTAYKYEARPVDADRNPAQGVGDSVWGFGVAGVALLARGQLQPADNFMLSVLPCPDECFATGVLYTTQEAYQHWDEVNTVSMYGDRVEVTYHSNMWSPRLNLTAFQVGPCLVAVEPAEWGALKRLYR